MFGVSKISTGYRWSDTGQWNPIDEKPLGKDGKT